MVKSERRVGVGSQRSQEKCLALKTITILSFDDDDYWKKIKENVREKIKRAVPVAATVYNHAVTRHSSSVTLCISPRYINISVVMHTALEDFEGWWLF